MFTNVLKRLVATGVIALASKFGCADTIVASPLADIEMTNKVYTAEQTKDLIDQATGVNKDRIEKDDYILYADRTVVYPEYTFGEWSMTTTPDDGGGPIYDGTPVWVTTEEQLGSRQPYSGVGWYLFEGVYAYIVSQNENATNIVYVYNNGITDYTTTMTRNITSTTILTNKMPVLSDLPTDYMPMTPDGLVRTKYGFYLFGMTDRNSDDYTNTIVYIEGGHYSGATLFVGGAEGQDDKGVKIEGSNIGGGSQILIDGKNVLTLALTDAKKYADNSFIPRLTETSYQDLVDLCSSSKLTPGAQYRITNYVATTIQENTSSASNQFDIIVVADSTNILNEVARAALHDGDKYFADSRLESWQVWYSISNDTQRFGWADVQNGRGVVYRLIDENKNDLPYDFKSIQFQRWPINKVDVGDYGGSTFDDMKLYFITNTTENNDMFYSYSYEYIDAGRMRFSSHEWAGTVVTSKFNYTFSAVDDSDASVSNVCAWSNTIKPNTVNGTAMLNNIVFLGCGTEEDDNVCRNYFGESSHTCTFGFGAVDNYFSGSCSNNLVAPYFAENYIGKEFRENAISAVVHMNRFNGNFDNNALGEWCYFNTFDNSVGTSWFGGDFSYGYIGPGCYDLVMGYDCRNIRIESRCHSIRFGSRTEIGSQYHNITIEKDNGGIILYATNAIASGQYYRNVTVKPRTYNGVSFDYKTIVDTNMNQRATTVYMPKNYQVISVE